MTLEEMNKKLDSIDAAAKTAKSKVLSEFAIANNPYKIGDIIGDLIGSITIKKIAVYIRPDGIPECIYIGLQLNEKGAISMKQNHTTIIQSNIKK